MLVGPLTLIASTCVPFAAGATPPIAGGAGVVTGTAPVKGCGAEGEGRDGSVGGDESLELPWLVAGTKIRTTVFPEPPVPGIAPAPPGVRAPCPPPPAHPTAQAAAVKAAARNANVARIMALAQETLDVAAHVGGRKFADHDFLHDPGAIDEHVHRQSVYVVLIA